MMLACDANEQSFGWAPPQWLGGRIPNTLVVRQDREPLDADVLEAFGDFCEYRLQGQFELATQLVGSPLQYRSVLRDLTREMSPETWSGHLSTWQSPSKLYQAQLAANLTDLLAGNYQSLRTGFK